MSTFQTLIVSLVLSRLDYGNAVLVGLPVHLYRRLQSVMNAAARPVYSLRFSDNISDALVSLRWLRSPERVTFKVAVLMYKAVRGSTPTYLSQLVRVADLPGRRSLRSTTFQSSAGSIRQTLCCRRPGLPSRRPDSLEQSA